MHQSGEGSRNRGTATAIFLLMLLVYNANGREIGNFDSRPTAFAGRELVLRGTLALNHVVGATPEYATRWGFIQTRDGRYRSIYSPVPSFAAAALIWPFWRTGLVDIRAPLAPRLMAKLTASVMVALATVFVYLGARSTLSRRHAVWIALAFGLGTGLWSTASQTLWQTETTVCGLALALLAFVKPRERIAWGGAAILGFGLMLAGIARPQMAPAIGILLIGAWWRWPRRMAGLAIFVVASGAALMGWLNWHWFAHPLGPLPLLTEVNATIHSTTATFGLSFEGLAGLLVSPNRGLLIFSPVAAVGLAGFPRAARAGWQSPYLWAALAAVAQYVLYASYSVWWGGHTYGPRYLLDVLPLLACVAVLTLTTPWGMGRQVVFTVAFVWSLVVAATGAFCYPHDAWNTDPISVDRHHERLWDIRDTQIVRCWRKGSSPQNFSLFTAAAVRRP